jgi:hypothetical protein
MWNQGDRVKVNPQQRRPIGLQGRLGTVLRTAPSGLVEVEMDSYLFPAGMGIVAFEAHDLLPTKKLKPRPKRRPAPLIPDEAW